MRTTLTLILFFLSVVGPVAQPVNQAALIDALSKGGDVQTVITQVRALGPENAGPELRAALIARLEQLNQRVAEVTKLDRTVDTFINPETLAHLAQLVAELHDPRAIPALSRSPYAPKAAVRALVEFGEKALPATMQIVMSPSSHYADVEHGLLTLRIMVEQGTLSPAALEQIRAAAKTRLTGEQYFTVVWNAIDLAATLRDPALWQIVSDLAQYPSESHRRGITNQEAEDLVERTQKRAADRLAGVPALPNAKMLFAPPTPKEP